MKFEILAPAGSQEALIAGVRCGANAVYLGGKALNARRNAGNFDEKELENAINYCHAREVKVYMTVNTLCRDDEIETAYELVGNAVRLGVDAFIVQDLGVAQMIRQCYPQARLHASTQTSVVTVSGVKELADAGFKRVVLPREMSAYEIEEIRRGTDTEIEIFVHGALCMSVSGQCFLSAMLGGRSGNRGLCAQPCRLNFSADKTPACDLSLKDLSLIEHLKEIETLGVTSLKIEGRMKRPEYVAAAVTAVKRAINGSINEKDETALKSVFSRSGFTDGYFTAKTGAAMFGTRKKEDVVAAEKVLKELSHLYDNENPLVPMNIDFTCKTGAPCRLEASALGKTVTVTGDIPETAINKPMTADSLTQRLSKLGGTQFYADKINVETDEGLIVPASSINAMRREAVEKLSQTEKREIIKNPLPVFSGRGKNAVPYYTARFENPEAIPDRHPFERVFIPIWSSTEDFVDNRAGVEIPRGMFGAEKRIAKELERLKKAGVTKALCPNIGAVRLARDMGFEVYGDFGLNVFNSIHAQQYKSTVLSFELTLEQANAINAPSTGIIVYGRLPLMLTRNCPVKSRVGCERCGAKGTLTDRKGIRFPVKCSPYPCVEVRNSVPLYMGDRMKEVKTDFAEFYFTDESKEQVEKIISLYQKGSKADFDYTRGLYYRGVL